MAIIEPHKFQCKYCKKYFTSESWYMSHKCKELVRNNLFKTVLGQAAWQHYQTWMLKMKRIVLRSDTFLSSKYFNSFVKYAKWAEEVNLPDKQMFIQLMIDKQISPTIWTNDHVYNMFVEYYDNQISPTVHAKITVATLFNLAEQFNCGVGQVFEHIDVNTIVSLLRQRKISPWILLNSSKFKQMLIERTNDDQRMMLQSLIRPEHWKKKFGKNADTVLKMKEFITEMHL